MDNNLVILDAKKEYTNILINILICQQENTHY